MGGRGRSRKRTRERLMLEGAVPWLGEAGMGIGRAGAWVQRAGMRIRGAGVVSAIIGARGREPGRKCDDYLQQSFLRMKMDFNTRRKKLPMELTLMCMSRDIIYD